MTFSLLVCRSHHSRCPLYPVYRSRGAAERREASDRDEDDININFWSMDMSDQKTFTKKFFPCFLKIIIKFCNACNLEYWSPVDHVKNLQFQNGAYSKRILFPDDTNINVWSMDMCDQKTFTKECPLKWSFTTENLKRKINWRWEDCSKNLMLILTISMFTIRAI